MPKRDSYIGSTDQTKKDFQTVNLILIYSKALQLCSSKPSLDENSSCSALQLIYQISIP
jgi:hypothetical protein